MEVRVGLYKAQLKTQSQQRQIGTGMLTLGLEGSLKEGRGVRERERERGERERERKG